MNTRSQVLFINLINLRLMSMALIILNRLKNGEIESKKKKNQKLKKLMKMKSQQTSYQHLEKPQKKKRLRRKDHEY